MISRLERVVGNYECRLRQSAAGRLSETQIRERVAHYGAAAAREDLVLDYVRQVLCSAGIVPMMFPAYHAFSRELGKLTRQEISRESMEREMSSTLAKWVMRGLSQKALLEIATTVFNLSLPTPPGEPSQVQGR